VGVSVGIAIAPEDGEQYEDLFKAADMALYRAKADGRGAWRWFEPEMNEPFWPAERSMTGAGALPINWFYPKRLSGFFL